MPSDNASNASNAATTRSDARSNAGARAPVGDVANPISLEVSSPGAATNGRQSTAMYATAISVQRPTADPRSIFDTVGISPPRNASAINAPDGVTIALPDRNAQGSVGSRRRVAIAPAYLRAGSMRGPSYVGAGSMRGPSDAASSSVPPPPPPGGAPRLVPTPLQIERTTAERLRDIDRVNRETLEARLDMARDAAREARLETARVELERHSASSRARDRQSRLSEMPGYRDNRASARDRSRVERRRRDRDREREEQTELRDMRRRMESLDDLRMFGGVTSSDDEFARLSRAYDVSDMMERIAGAGGRADRYSPPPGMENLPVPNLRPLAPGMPRAGSNLAPGNAGSSRGQQPCTCGGLEELLEHATPQELIKYFSDKAKEMERRKAERALRQPFDAMEKELRETLRQRRLDKEMEEELEQNRQENKIRVDRVLTMVYGEVSKAAAAGRNTWSGTVEIVERGHVNRDNNNLGREVQDALRRVGFKDCTVSRDVAASAGARSKYAIAGVQFDENTLAQLEEAPVVDCDDKKGTTLRGKCFITMEEDVELKVLHPCGHAIGAASCSRALSSMHGKCPVCRETVQSVNSVFLP